MARIFNEGFELGNQGQFFSHVGGRFGPSTSYPARIPGGYVADLDKFGSLTARLKEPLAEFYTRFLYFANTWSKSDHYGRRLAMIDAAGKMVASVGWGYAGQPGDVHGIGLHVAGKVVATPSPLKHHEHRAVIEVHFRYTPEAGSASRPNFEMRVNGATVLVYAGPTAIEPDPPPEEPIEWAIRDIIYSAAPNKWAGIDDVAINDTNGSVDNGWCGDGVIVRLAPNGSSKTELKPSDPARPSFELVADRSGATWVESDIAGSHDIYTVAAPTLNPNDTIKRVWAQAHARKLNADSPGVVVGLDRGSGIEWSETSEIGLDFTGVRGTAYTSQGGAAWTHAALSQLKVGVKVE